MLYLYTRYHDDFESELIVNTNVGGDNCHRGAVLGTILGASLWVDAIPKHWINGFNRANELYAENEGFVAQLWIKYVQASIVMMDAIV